MKVEGTFRRVMQKRSFWQYAKWTSLLHIIVISKVFELQRSETTHLIDFLQLFQMLTDFLQFRLL